MKRFSITLIKKIGVIIFGVLLTLAFVSCEFFNLDIKEVLHEKLDTASVERVEFNESRSPKNDRGITCIPSDWGHEFNVWIRNPRAYDLDMTYTLDDGSTCTSAFYSSYDDYTASSTNADISCIYENGYRYGYVKLSDDFAHDREMNEIDRDISGVITLTNHFTGISFEPFPVSLRVNTPPPDISNVMLQRDSTGTKYILCFEMEDLTSSGNDIHWDTHVLKMNGSTYYFNPATFNGTLYTDQARTMPSSSFVTTRPSGMQPLKDEGEEFEASDPSDNVITIYYLTDVSVTTNEKTWSFYLQDDEGLVTPTHKITNIARELTAPVIRATSGNTYDVEETGNYYFEVSHDLKCLDSSALLDNVTIYVYYYDESGSLTNTEHKQVTPSDRTATFYLVKGTYPRIKVVARKEGYTSSDPREVTNITVRQPTNFYVSSEGREYGVGTVTYPYRTIQNVVDYFLNEFDDVSCNIYVLDDLTPSSGDFDSSNGSSSSLVSIPSEADGKTINIIGWDKNSNTRTNRTINAQRSSSSEGSVFAISGGTVNLKNLTIKGGYADYGAGVRIFNSSEAVTLTDCTITGNTAYDDDNLGIGGAGLYMHSGTSNAITLTNCTISNNEAAAGTGGGIGAYSGDIYLNNCTFTGNSAINGGGLFQYEYVHAITVNGITMTGNTASSTGNGGAIALGAGLQGSFTLGGTVSIPGTSGRSNGIFLDGSSSGHETMAIGSTYTYSGAAAVVDFPSSSYIQGSTVFTGNPGKVGSSIMPADPSFIITTAGALSIQPNIYVSSYPTGSSSGDGSQAHPYDYVTAAITRIKELNVAADFIIHVSGTIYHSNGLTISNSTSSLGTATPSSIKIVGTNPENDKLDRNANSASTVTISSSVPCPIIFENLTITGGAGTSGGGINVGSNADVSLKNCKVTGNHATNGGGLYTNGTLTLDGVEVSGNYSESTGFGGGIYVDAAGTLKIKGKVTVTGNTNGSGASATTNNVYLYEGTAITVDGALNADSRIGVTTYGEPTEGSSGHVVFTENIENSNLTSAQRSAVFLSDAGYAVIASGEMELARSDGTFNGGMPSGNLSFTYKDAASNGNNVTSFYTGYSKNIYITASNGTDASPNVIPPSDISYTITLKCGSHLAATLTATPVSGTNAVKVTIPASVEFPQNYTLYVSADYSGTTYSGNCNLEGKEAPAGFVAVMGANVSGAVSDSSVFITDRTVAIPNMLVCDHEVTQAEYQSVMNTNPSNFTTGVASGENQNNRPVENVSWYAAIAYCNKRSSLEGLTPCYSISGIPSTDWATFAYSSIPTSSDSTWDAVTCNFTANGYRLPTEAEWEYLARGGNDGIPSTQTTYSGSDSANSVAWYTSNSSNKTHEVKKKTANSLGIYDMSGNVYEWCWDWADEITATTGSSGPSSVPSADNKLRSTRGGAYTNNSDRCRVYFRDNLSPQNKGQYLGFRVVRTAQ